MKLLLSLQVDDTNYKHISNTSIFSLPQSPRLTLMNSPNCLLLLQDCRSVIMTGKENYCNKTAGDLKG